MNYFGDPHDMAVMIAIVRRALDIVGKLRAAHEIGDVLVATRARRQARLHGRATR